MEQLGAQNITLIGAGAVGSFTALSLIKMGIGSLEVYDHDTVSPHNLPNQWFRPEDIDKAKVDALATLLRTFGGVVTPHAEKFSRQRVKGIVVSAVDSMAVRRDVWRHIRKCRTVPFYVDARMGGEFGMVLSVDLASVESIEFYEKHLYSDGEAAPVPCTAQSIIYCTAGLGAYVASTVGGYIRKDPPRPYIGIDFRNGITLLRSPDA